MGKCTSAKIVPLLTLESQLKRRVRVHLQLIGYSRNEKGALILPGQSKESYRGLHRHQRETRLIEERAFIDDRFPTLGGFFANGREISPERIEARLELVNANTWQSDLFRLASLTWSIPVSRGYGRRLRFLVWDNHNNKLLGLIGLTDPVFNLSVRDQWIGWSSSERKLRLVNVMDAFVLGAVPPYNKLLGGKLIATLLRTKEVCEAFAQKYTDKAGLISKQYKHSHLALITTSSALGRSSVYNRLRLHARQYFIPLGYTRGWGHFHLPDALFDEIRQYLRASGHDYHSNNRFGDGPSWKMRAIRQAFTMIGLAPDLLKHGIKREVFACPLADNAQRVLLGKDSVADYSSLLDAANVSRLARDRWLVPRSKRVHEYLDWQVGSLRSLLDLTSSDRATKAILQA